MRLATDRTDFSAALLVEQPAVIVLKCPGRYMKGFGPYLAAILQKLMLDLDTVGEKAGGALPRPVKIVIDEFPVMGKLDAVVEAVNLFRKRRISFVIAMQSIAPLYNIYGRDGAETLISGMATQIVFGSCDHATAHDVTQVLGKGTRQVRVRDLMTVDEVISPSRGNCTILYRYATTTYAAQVVMLAALSYMFDRDDWQRAIQQSSGALAFDDLVVTHNPFARKKPQQPRIQPAHTEEASTGGIRDRRFLMRYMDLVKSVQRQLRKRLSYHILDTILRACFAVIARTLEQGEPVYIPEFGHFEITIANSRVVVSNLGGKTRYKVPKRKCVRFMPSAILVDELNSEGDK